MPESCYHFVRSDIVQANSKEFFDLEMYYALHTRLESNYSFGFK